MEEKEWRIRLIESVVATWGSNDWKEALRSKYSVPTNDNDNALRSPLRAIFDS